MFQQTPFTPLWTKTIIVLFEIKPHSFRPCLPFWQTRSFSFSWPCGYVFSSLSFSIFFRSEWEEKRIISLFFLLHFLFWERSGTGTENERKLLFLLFFLSFCFFSSVFSPFSLFFSLFFLVWERGAEGEMAIEIFVISSLFSSFFGKEMGRKMEIKSLSFFLFFFFFRLLLFRFFFFLERK